MQYLVLLAALVACVAGVPLSSTNPQLDGRIVGGTATTITAHPWQVSLQYSGSHICGGSIYSSHWIVTAARCIIGDSVTAFTVRAGSTYSNSGGTILKVSRIVIHGSYNPSTYDYDVAVVQMTTAFTFSTSIKAIPLEIGTLAAGSNVVVTGWGATSELGSASTTLLGTTVQIINDATCKSDYTSAGSITASMICAGVPGGGKDACQGDYGGPLVSVNNTLVGIVSWGMGCGRPQYPGVYSRVSYLSNWILINAV